MGELIRLIVGSSESVAKAVRCAKRKVEITSRYPWVPSAVFSHATEPRDTVALPSQISAVGGDAAWKRCALVSCLTELIGFLATR